MAEPLIVDVETYWDSTLSLTKMNMTEYSADARTRPYSISVTELNGHCEVAWLEDIPRLLKEYDYQNQVVFAYNARFDLQNIAMHYGLRPKAGMCLMDLMFYRYPLANKRVSLAKVAKAFGWPDKEEGPGSAKFLNGVTGQQVYDTLRSEAESYVRHDGALALSLLKHLLYDHVTPVPHAQLFTMHWAISQYIDPVIELDQNVLAEEVRRINTARQHALQRCGMSITELRSDATLLAALQRAGAQVPMKQGARGPIPEFAKDDPFMLGAALRDGPVGDIVRARIECNSSTNITRAESYLRIAKLTNNKWPVHLTTSGAKTHRFTGGDGGGGSPLNLQRGSAMRQSLIAPDGYRFVGFDKSKFELGIARWMAHDEITKAAILNGEDPYITFASRAFGVPIEELTDDHPYRQVGKECQLAAQYGVGGKRLYDTIRSRGIEGVSEKQCHAVVKAFRYSEHPTLKYGWDDSMMMLTSNWTRSPSYINLPGTPIEGEGWQWPSGRTLVMRNLKLVGSDYYCLNGLPLEQTPDKMYGGKVFQRFCQSMANEIIQEKKEILTNAGYRVCLEVYDEMLVVIKETADYTDIFNEITSIATAPVSWWDNQPPFRIGKLAAVHNYKEAK